MGAEESFDESIILDENIKHQAIVPFQGDDLAAAITNADEIYVTISGICSALGLSARPQLRRILGSASLAKGLRRIPLKTSGGIQRLYCIRIDKVALWLAGIETNKVKPQFRAKIEAYQDELAPVATRVFMRVLGIPSPPMTDPRVAALAEQYAVLMTAATFISEHMEALTGLPNQVAGVSDQLAQAVQLLEALAQQQEATTEAVQDLAPSRTVTAAQKLHIKDAVNRIAEDSMGKPGALTHGQIYGALYRRFKVSAYAEIPVTSYDAVIAFLRDLWKRATSGATPEQNSLF